MRADNVGGTAHVKQSAGGGRKRPNQNAADVHGSRVKQHVKGERVRKHSDAKAPDQTTKTGGANGSKDATQGAGKIGQIPTQGGGAGDLRSILETLVSALSQLATAIGHMVGGGAAGGGGCSDMGASDHHGVGGVQGTGASDGQYVAPVVTTSTTASGREDSDYEQRVLDLINAERAKYGLGKVTYNATLDAAAEKHNQQMALTGTMAHDGIGDGTPGERIRAEGFRDSWGENVATGQLSPEQVVREWMNSPDHRRNILDPNFRQMGVGYTTSSSGRTYWAQEFGA